MYTPPMDGFTIIHGLGPGSTMGEAKNGVKQQKHIGERSEPSGGLGRGERAGLFPRLTLGSLRFPIFSLFRFSPTV